MKRRIGLLGNKLMTEIDSESELNKNEIGISLDQNNEISGVQVLDENRKISSIYKKFDINRYKVYLMMYSNNGDGIEYLDITPLIYLGNKYEVDFDTESIYSKVKEEYEKNPDMFNMYMNYKNVRDFAVGKISANFWFTIIDTFKYSSVEQYSADLVSGLDDLVMAVLVGVVKQNVIYRDLPNITFPTIHYNGKEIKIINNDDNFPDDYMGLNVNDFCGDLTEKTFDKSQNSEVLAAIINFSTLLYSIEDEGHMYPVILPTVKIKLLITPDDLDENGKLK